MRFSSYSSEWHSYTLSEILTFYSTNSFSREKLNYDTGSVKNIHYGDIHTKFPSIVSIDNNKDIPFINDDLDLSKFSEDQYLREGDLIIADASEDYEDIGKAIEVKDINNEKVLAGLHTILARDENDMTVNGFKAYLFSTNNLKTKIKIIANGISVLGISKNNLSKLNVEIPSKKEQQNIVSFISDIDKKIELLEKKHQLYLDFKNYLMQHIFAQKLRFDDNCHYKTKKVKDFLTESKIEGTDDINKRLTVKLNLKGITVRESKTIEKEGATKQFIRKSGQFIYGKQNLHKGAFGIVPKELDGYLSSSDIPSFDFKGEIEPKWFYYYFSRKSFYESLESLSTGTGSKRISPKEFLNIKLIVPELKEQHRIVCLRKLMRKLMEFQIKFYR